MSYSKLGLKVLGLSFVAALSVMTVAAAGAQAEAHWFINSSETPEIGAAEEGNDFLLLAKFGLTTVEVLCTKIKVDDGLLLEDGSGLGEALFSSCQTILNKSVTADCKPLEPVIAKVKNLPIHHKEDTYILVSPHDGTLKITTIHFGAKCAIGQNIEVTGHVVAECGSLWESSWTHEDCSNEKEAHEFRLAPTELFPEHTLKFGVNTATVHGDVKLSFIGFYAGLKWGAL